MKIISLGYACDTAYQIRRVTGQTEAYPFDWLMTPFETLLKLISERFHDFLEPKNLAKNAKGQVFDAKSDVYFLHDFAESDNIEEKIGEIKEKYLRRINRLFKVLESGEKVVFIRSRQYEDSEVMTIDKASEILDAIRRIPGIGNVQVVGVNNMTLPVPTVKSGDASVFSIKSPDKFVWMGDNAEWDRVLHAVSAGHYE